MCWYPYMLYRYFSAPPVNMTLFRVLVCGLRTTIVVKCALPVHQRSAALCVTRGLSKTVSDSKPDLSPLAGIRVLDLTRIVAGPYCTMILGDLGAEVIKVERPGEGDECRNWGPPFIGNTTETCYFIAVNRNKKSICVDFKTEAGRQIVYDLAAKSDVLIENFVPGKLAKLKLDYENVQRVSPSLVYCSLTGYGSVGPYCTRPGYDVIAASIGGLLHITGPRGGEPSKVGVAMTDIATGLYAHGAIMAALLQRTNTGRGQKIDCNLLSTQVACLINIGSNYLNAGQEAERLGTAHASLVPYESFPTQDGGYLTICAGSEKQFLSLCQLLSLPELSSNEMFMNNEQRVKNRELLIDILRKRFREKSMAEWLKILEGSPFPYGPVNSIEQDVPTLRLRLKKPKPKKSVQWRQGTVDNEHMNKKKSKCCCQYQKPHEFDESSSEEEDDECDNCHGHVERKKKPQPIAECTNLPETSTEPTPSTSEPVPNRVGDQQLDPV